MTVKTATRARLVPNEDGTVLLQLSPTDVLLWPDAMRVAAALLECACIAGAGVGAEEQIVLDVIHQWFPQRKDDE